MLETILNIRLYGIFDKMKISYYQNKKSNTPFSFLKLFYSRFLTKIWIKLKRKSGQRFSGKSLRISSYSETKRPFRVEHGFNISNIRSPLKFGCSRL